MNFYSETLSPPSKKEVVSVISNDNNLIQKKSGNSESVSVNSFSSIHSLDLNELKK